MANLMDYLDWRGDLTLEISPFNEVDALILAELSFVDFGGIVPPPELGRGLPLSEAAEAFFARHGGRDVAMGVLVPDTISKMLRKLMVSPRFRNMILNGYTDLLDDAIEQQFAALTIDLGNGSIYISFRGTDDTIVGWKEDLNMGFLEEIPSQKQAVEYVARIARQYGDRTIRIGGHSKGGNLAVYSAAKSSGEIQERIVAIHNNDGPGFAWDISETPGHKRIAGRIHTVLPQTSVVGMLMEHEKRYQVVYSTYDGLYQHDGFSWEVKGTQFVHLDDFSREGKLVDETIDKWADSLNTQQREALADALYTVHRHGRKNAQRAHRGKAQERVGDAQDLQKSRPREPPHGERSVQALLPPRHEEPCPRHAGGGQPGSGKYPQKDRRAIPEVGGAQKMSSLPLRAKENNKRGHSLM